MFTVMVQIAVSPLPLKQEKIGTMKAEISLLVCPFLNRLYTYLWKGNTDPKLETL